MIRSSRHARVLAAAVGVVALVGCSGPTASPSTTPAATTAAATTAATSTAATTTAATTTAATTTAAVSTASTAAPATSGTSASASLARFFAAANAMDSALRVAAAQVNRGVHTDSITIDRTTVASITAIDPWSLVATVPGGLDRATLTSVLQVFVGLSSRRYAFLAVVEDVSLSPLARPGAESSRILDCLAKGAAPAAAYASDLGAARAAATRAPAPPALAPSSREVADVAIWAHTLYLPNACAEECGGYVPRPVTLPAIVWRAATLAPGSTWDGTVGTAWFTARYEPDHTWSVGTNAC